MSIASILYNELSALVGVIKYKTAKTRNNSIIPIRRIFDAAYQDGLISSNPAERLLYVKPHKKQPDRLTLEEVELVLGHIFEHFPPTIKVISNWRSLPVLGHRNKLRFVGKMLILRDQF